MAVMDIIIRAVDEASKVMGDIKDRGVSTGKTLKDNWKQIGAATAVAGTAIEAFARKQAPLTEQTNKLANALDMTSDEVRGLALETSNVTFPLDEAISLMKMGREQGIKSAEGLKEYATFWDMVGDATGESSEMLAKSVTGLRAVGVAAGEEEQALGAFGYVSRESAMDVGEFLQVLERMGPELQEVGLGVDETAGILGYMEKELGLASRTARQEFRQAVNESDGELSVLLETLGMTEEQFKTYTQSVKDSSGVIEEDAEAHANSYTLIQKMQHAVGELSYKYGDLIGMASQLAPILMVVGPAMKGISVVTGALSAVTSGALIPALTGAISSVWAFTAALLANPITLIVAAIAALVGAIILLWKNWDSVSDFLSKSWEFLKTKAMNFISAVSKIPAKLWEILSNVASKVWEWKDEMISAIVDAAKNMVSGFVDFISQLPGELAYFAGEVTRKIVDSGKEFFNKAKQAGQELVDGFVNVVKGLPGKIWDILTGTAGKLKDIGSNLWSNAKDAAGNIWSGFKKGLGINSPSYLEKSMDDILEKSGEMSEGLSKDFRNLDKANPELGFNSPEDIKSPRRSSQQESAESLIMAIRELIQFLRASEENRTYLKVGTLIGDDSSYRKLSRILDKYNRTEKARVGANL